MYSEKIYCFLKETLFQSKRIKSINFKYSQKNCVSFKSNVRNDRHFHAVLNAISIQVWDNERKLHSTLLLLFFFSTFLHSVIFICLNNRPPNEEVIQDPVSFRPGRCRKFERIKRGKQKKAVYLNRAPTRKGCERNRGDEIIGI